MTHEFQIQRASTPDTARRAAALANPGFGTHFTDHMVTIVWQKDTGWQQPQVHPYAPLTVDPASAVLHYGQEIFEGLKAYRQPDGAVALFRPERNGERLNKSARRLALPELPVELFVRACEELVKIDSDWVSDTPGHSLYLRPFMIADEVFLGVRSAHRARFMIIASPVGHYFPDGVKPVKLWLATEMKRAGHGGTGFAKCGGNYAGSLAATDEAYANGCQQVLFTDSHDSDRIDELGGMNLFLVRQDGTVVTPETNGNILEGVTRDSLIQLLEDAGHRVEQRRVTLSEWQQGVATGEIQEAFACGTAAVIAPIGSLKGPNGFEITLPQPAGETTMALREKLTGIQTGRIADSYGWVRRVS